MIPANVEWYKQFSQFRRDSKIKKCFREGYDECGESIVAAHSIQRNGVLDILESEISGKMAVLSFLDLEFNEKGEHVGFRTLGKKVASTFSGFCNFHDRSIFQNIEINSIDVDNIEHLFKLSYRAFSKDWHAKIETLKGFETNEVFNRPQFQDMVKLLIRGSEFAKRDFTKVKNKLNEILSSGSFDDLYYVTYTLLYISPITTSGAFSPEYSYRNNLLNKTTDPSIPYESVILTVIPTRNEETHIVLACLPEDAKSMKFIKEIDKLPDLLFERAISSVIVAYLENTFISPQFWLSLPEKNQKLLLDELSRTHPTLRNMSNRFFHSGINFFRKDYALKIN